MKNITIKNLSTLTDAAAVGRVAFQMAGDEAQATRDANGKRIVKITKRGNAYTVADKE